MQETLEPLFQRYRVDLALWGHIHMYERTYPLTYNGTRSTSREHGTVHVIVGKFPLQTPPVALIFTSSSPSFLCCRKCGTRISGSVAGRSTREERRRSPYMGSVQITQFWSRGHKRLQNGASLYKLDGSGHRENFRRILFV